MTRPRLGVGVKGGERYRTVPEDKVIDFLRLGGWAYAPNAAAAEAEAREALAALTDHGLVMRSNAAGQRFYDPVEVLNVFKAAGLAGADGFWRDRWVATGRRLVEDLRPLNEGERFVVDLTRTLPQASAPAARLRAPLPLVGAGMRDLEISLVGAGEAAARISPGRIEARASGSGPVVLASRSAFCASGYAATAPSGPLAPEARNLYLRAREGLIVISPAIADLALRLAGRGAAPLAAVARFWSFLMDEMVCGALHYDQVDVAAPCDWALATGVVDCQLGSALLVALCRSIGLPARLVGGYFLYERAPGNHYWAEIWFDETGWTPFDLISWDLSLGGQDASWRNHFFANLDARMITQRMPLEFTGAVGVRIPDAWHLLQSGTPTGVALDLVDLEGGRVYGDHVSVTRSARGAP